MIKTNSIENLLVEEQEILKEIEKQLSGEVRMMEGNKTNSETNIEEELKNQKDLNEVKSNSNLNENKSKKNRSPIEAILKKALSPEDTKGATEPTNMIELLRKKRVDPEANKEEKITLTEDKIVIYE